MERYCIPSADIAQFFWGPQGRPPFELLNAAPKHLWQLGFICLGPWQASWASDKVLVCSKDLYLLPRREPSDASDGKPRQFVAGTDRPVPVFDHGAFGNDPLSCLKFLGWHKILDWEIIAGEEYLPHPGAHPVPPNSVLAVKGAQMTARIKLAKCGQPMYFGRGGIRNWCDWNAYARECDKSPEKAKHLLTPAHRRHDMRMSTVDCPPTSLPPKACEPKPDTPLLPRPSNTARMTNIVTRILDTLVLVDKMLSDDFYSLDDLTEHMAIGYSTLIQLSACITVAKKGRPDTAKLGSWTLSEWQRQRYLYQDEFDNRRAIIAAKFDLDDSDVEDVYSNGSSNADCDIDLEDIQPSLLPMQQLRAPPSDPTTCPSPAERPHDPEEEEQRGNTREMTPDRGMLVSSPSRKRFSNDETLGRAGNKRARQQDW
jgi:hypothetical protein